MAKKREPPALSFFCLRLVQIRNEPAVKDTAIRARVRGGSGAVAPIANHHADDKTTRKCHWRIVHCATCDCCGNTCCSKKGPEDVCNCIFHIVVSLIKQLKDGELTNAARRACQSLEQARPGRSSQFVPAS